MKTAVFLYTPATFAVGGILKFLLFVHIAKNLE